MCLLIYKPQGTAIPEGYLENGFMSNPHGAGIAYRESTSTKIKIKKGFFTYTEFLNAYELLDPLSEMIIHFRLATSGLKDRDNCHPFNIHTSIPKIIDTLHVGEFVMAHNGIFSQYSYDKVDHSDTVYFVKNILSKYDFTNLSKKHEAEIQKAVGLTNKIVVMGNAKTYIFNQESGIWDDSIRYSNAGYKDKPYYGLWHEGYDYNEDDGDIIQQLDSETVTVSKDIQLIGSKGRIISIPADTYEIRNDTEEEKRAALSYKEMIDA